PRHLAQDPVLYGECLGGAMYWNDFLTQVRAVGFNDPRLVESAPMTITAEEVARKIGHIGFYSATYRLFKIAELENACEDYGQAVVYRGSVPGHAERLVLDQQHVMERGKAFPVCGNTWRMLHDTRFAEHFDFIGNQDTHLGIFEGCGTALPFAADAAPEAGAGGGSCC
ncbi:MAG: methyltransferase type 11, partial [Gammaproteobacteria bacterium]|nr:methyltransferase type 11 [Gammaproteobacteria bacterium]